MADNAITTRVNQIGLGYHVFEHYTNGQITAAVLHEWIVPFYCVIKDVIVDSETANAGAGNDVLDIHLNGTTIYTTQGNRPTLTAGDTGLWAEAGEPEVTTLVPGDVLLAEVDSVGATNGSARVKVSIVVGVGR